MMGKDCPKHVELILKINKLFLIYLVLLYYFTALLFKATTFTNQTSLFLCHCYQKKELGGLETSQHIDTLSSNPTIKASVLSPLSFGLANSSPLSFTLAYFPSVPALSISFSVFKFRPHSVPLTNI